MIREFTGRHMLFVMLAMFGTIIAVNLVMARYAVATFGGTVVANSYVASQDYNRWLAEARAQEVLGWSVETRLMPGRLVEVLASQGEGVLVATAHHPLGRAPDRELRFAKMGAGRWLSTDPLPPGRWRLRIRFESAGKVARFVREIPA
ncbi:MAG: hypothetical protein EON57_01480 [Alphaproteobacteria bacterium]|nr:MAG: hypothetical protein EON57_01480 [Alphaproteobacteria bacterium]